MRIDIMFSASFTIFGGILSEPVAFLGFMFLIILFISSRNVKSNCCRIYVVFDVYNATVIFILFNDIF